MKKGVKITVGVLGIGLAFGLGIGGGYYLSSKNNQLSNNNNSQIKEPQQDNKEQAPKILDLHDIVNTMVNELPGSTWIMQSIYQSHQFRQHMNNFLTSNQYQLFLTLSFDEFD